MPVAKFDQGDTIIEVLFAITIFSLVAVGGISLMNQGLAIAQRSLEIGLVRQQIDAQADALRYLNRAYAVDYGKDGAATELWNNIVVDNATAAEVGAQPFDTVSLDGECHIPSDPADQSSNSFTGKAFTLNLNDLTSGTVLMPTSDVVTYAKVSYDNVPNMAPPPRAEGIWIQAVESPHVGSGSDERPGFYDFHIRACWHSPGQAEPITLGTIVRLYEPRGE